ncbi:hypothetical protein CAEBREN_05855 [Caenorhabditis brenneri]|uniref:NR LBD domain-containing protein n=1 Tax=Caenorhabditis brenneri TaxID=135651 RepID=G0M9B7_CAEBE|nr:hypothetical protein CAEBREN_05855 [Caenorhabditis brenneri]
MKVFRRTHMSVTTEYRKCRQLNHQCVPLKSGKWFCKKCRFRRCEELGMSAKNIQYDRDSLKGSITLSENLTVVRSNRMKTSLPKTIESILGAPHLVSFIRQTGRNQDLPHVDTSRLVQKAIQVILTPNMVVLSRQTSRKTSNLEQLTQGLLDFRSDQKETLSEVYMISQDDYKQEFETNMCAAAKWLSCSDRIKEYDDELKIILLRSIWWVWGRLEQISTTARMRIREKCGKRQFVYSSNTLVNYDNMSSDLSCWSKYAFEEMRYFFLPSEMFYDDVIHEMMLVQPDDVELTFLMCNLCFQVTGKTSGSHIAEEMERLQDILSNDLHEYYIEKNQPMYSLRVKHLMKIQDLFLKLRNIRQEKYEIGSIFNILNRSFSNPEFFACSP